MRDGMPFGCSRPARIPELIEYGVGIVFQSKFLPLNMD
jgi:hypothetical protein